MAKSNKKYTDKFNSFGDLNKTHQNMNKQRETNYIEFGKRIFKRQKDKTNSYPKILNFNNQTDDAYALINNIKEFVQGTMIRRDNRIISSSLIKKIDNYIRRDSKNHYDLIKNKARLYNAFRDIIEKRYLELFESLIDDIDLFTNISRIQEKELLLKKEEWKELEDLSSKEMFENFKSFIESISSFYAYYSR